MDFKLTSKDKLTTTIKNNGIYTWNELIEFVKNLPYGRNANRTNFKLVITQRKGSCSSKHALLKKVADLNAIPNIKLILGMYRMSKKNTPKIGNVLSENSIDAIPEAHCYLKINNKRIDITTQQSNFSRIENEIISEMEIEAEQVSTFKVEYHKDYLKKWSLENNMKRSFQEIWQIREQCIKNIIEINETY